MFGLRRLCGRVSAERPFAEAERNTSDHSFEFGAQDRADGNRKGNAAAFAVR